MNDDNVDILEPLIRTIVGIGQQIKQAVAHLIYSPLQVATKSSFADLVTNLDIDVESQLIQALEQIKPGALVVSEETDVPGSKEVFWMVDPMDGTTNIVHGVPHAAISVALHENQRPIMGVIYNPFTDVVYHATLGHGAWRRDLQTSDNDVRLAVSRTHSLSGALIAFGLPYDRKSAPLMFEVASTLFQQCQDLRRNGSASLDLVQVAEGIFDGYIELNLKSWDIAAGGLIIEESGGVITTWDGTPPYRSDRYTSTSVIASNGRLHADLLKIAQTESNLKNGDATAQISQTA